MIISKSACGLCKPTKKVKRNNTKLKSFINNSSIAEDLTISLIKSYERKFKH